MGLAQIKKIVSFWHKKKIQRGKVGNMNLNDRKNNSTIVKFAESNVILF